jgi:hypothetical protein
LPKEQNRNDLVHVLKTRQSLLDIAKKYPLALTKLWTPYCHRWDGMAKKSKRAKGCGQAMDRISPGVWFCPKCQITEKRTSQAEPLFNLGREATMISGGNRAGKTELGAMLAIASAAGSKEWWVREWLNLNNLPHDLIQPNPSTVWASALSYADSLSYVRPKLTRFAPEGCKGIKWNAQDRGTLILPNGGKIVAMSADSGREKYQGAGGDISMIWLDR